MIAFVRGELAVKETARVVVDAGGVGYEALIPLSTFDSLPPEGAQVKLFTCHVVREDSQTLYAFATEREKRVFEMVTSVSGVGPKLALAILSGMGTGDLMASVADGDAKRLASVKGIGRKTAERIVVELRDKVNPIEAAAVSGASSAGDGIVRDAMLALVALGFAEDAARKQVQKALEADPPATDTETIVRRALSGK